MQAALAAHPQYLGSTLIETEKVDRFNGLASGIQLFWGG